MIFELRELCRGGVRRAACTTTTSSGYNFRQLHAHREKEKETVGEKDVEEKANEE